MRWRGKRQSNNIEDMRGVRGPSSGGLGGGALKLLPTVFRILGPKGGIAVVVAIGVYGIFSGNLGSMLGVGTQDNLSSQQSQTVEQSEDEKELVDFISVVLADTEQTWHNLFQQTGGTYEEPVLVLFRGSVRSACGMGQAATGPLLLSR